MNVGPKCARAMASIATLFLTTALVSLAQNKDLGIFSSESSVGQTPSGVKASYDAAKGEYTITGGGANVWGTTDAFYFVWKKVNGDVSLSADIKWVGTSAAEHRKAMLMLRQSLEPGSLYADAVSHGNGLTSLQFRGAANENTYQVVAADTGPAPIRLRIERKGSRITMYFGKPGSDLQAAGPVEFIGMPEPFYVGLGVCSHVATTLETAVFSNVKLEENSPAK
jgi:TolB protein